MRHKISKKPKSAWQELAKLNAAPRTEVAQSAPRETLKSFTHNYEQARFAPVRAAEAQLSESLRQLRAQQAVDLFNEESEYLNENCPLTQDGDFTEKDSVESIRVRVRNAFDSARLLTEEQDGIRLEPSALAKCQAVSRKNLQVSWIAVDAWATLIRHMLELGALTEHDVTHLRVETPAPTEPSAQSFDDVIATANGETRDGQRALRISAMLDYQQETYTWFLAWQKSVIENLNWLPTEQDIQNITNFMRDHNLSPVSAKSWDAARVACCSAGLLSNSNAMYPDEKLAAIISDDSTDTRSFNGRMALRRVEAQIKRGTL